jgi:shikimate dehydrogenase
MTHDRPKNPDRPQAIVKPFQRLEHVVQPLVACLGNPVAGNPTQFVMSRIARDAELDWRFFTSQVDLAAFEPAFRGVQALGMAGLAILPPFQSLVAPLLDSVTPAAQVSGRVTVAKAEGAGWIGDETATRALARCMASRFALQSIATEPVSQPPAQSIAVFGSQMLCRSIRLALTTIPGDFQVVRLIEPIAMTTKGTRDAAIPPLDEPPPEADTSGANGGSKAGATAPVTNVTLESLTHWIRPVRGLIVEDPMLMMETHASMRARWLRDIPWADHPVAFLMPTSHGSSSERSTQILSDEIRARGLEQIDEVDWLTHQAAVDFHFWTGYEADMDLVRESFEEYLQW